jgi:hypothetical protein
MIPVDSSFTQSSAEEMDLMSRCVIVLGPYRSGTSLTAQVLERLGVDFGPVADRIATNRFNPGGYLERGDLNELNRRLITSAGRTLGHPGEPESLTRLADRSILEGINLPWNGHASTWGLKDPRFCATLKIWVDSGALTADSLRIVRLIRDSDAVVRSSLEHPSVRRFCEGDLQRARQMVHEYTKLADWQVKTLGLPVLNLAYDDLLRDPIEVITRIADWLGMNDSLSISKVARCVGKRSARRRFHIQRSATLPFRAFRKACRVSIKAVSALRHA